MKNNQISNTKTAREMKEAKDSSDRANMIRQRLIEYKEQEDEGETEDLRGLRTNMVTKKRQRTIEIPDDDQPCPQKPKTALSVAELSPYAFTTVAAIDAEMRETEWYQRRLLRKAELTVAENGKQMSVGELEAKLAAFISSLS
jgi:hypothetical protein